MADPGEVTHIIKASVQLRAKLEEEHELCIPPSRGAQYTAPMVHQVGWILEVRGFGGVGLALVASPLTPQEADGWMGVLRSWRCSVGLMMDDG